MRARKFGSVVKALMLIEKLLLLLQIGFQIMSTLKGSSRTFRRKMATLSLTNPEEHSKVNRSYEEGLDARGQCYKSGDWSEFVAVPAYLSAEFDNDDDSDDETNNGKETDNDGDVSGEKSGEVVDDSEVKQPAKKKVNAKPIAKKTAPKRQSKKAAHTPSKQTHAKTQEKG